MADLSRGAVQCFDFALDCLGLPAVSPEAVRRTIGMTLQEVLAQLTASESQDKAEEFVRLFIRKADEVMAEGTVVFEPVRR